MVLLNVSLTSQFTPLILVLLPRYSFFYLLKPKPFFKNHCQLHKLLSILFCNLYDFWE